MTPIAWYALDAQGRIIEECEALDKRSAELVFSVCCRAAAFVQSKPSWEESRREDGIPKRRRVEEEEGDGD